MRAQVGVIGGMGPMATAYYLERVVAMTQGERDQDHISMLIYNHTTIPDRTAFLLGQSDQDPLPEMVADAKALEASGCDFLAIPCNTAHDFYEKIQAGVGIPLIHLIRETVAYAKGAGAKTLAVLATDGTLATHTYQREVEAQGLKVCLPEAHGQARVMAMIYDGVKAGRPVPLEAFQDVAREMRAQGADCIILGCTELSVLKRDLAIDDPDVLDSIDVLARETVLRAGRSLTPAGNLLEVANGHDV